MGHARGEDDQGDGVLHAGILPDPP
jgi:hypothetical protein